MKEVVMFWLLPVNAPGSNEKNILIVVLNEFISFSLNSQVHFSFCELIFYFQGLINCFFLAIKLCGYIRFSSEPCRYIFSACVLFSPMELKEIPSFIFCKLCTLGKQNIQAIGNCCFELYCRTMFSRFLLPSRRTWSHSMSSRNIPAKHWRNIWTSL